METTSQNKLGTMPIVKLLISMSLPMMISFFINALYNMVDAMFVARISEDALTAVTLATPIQNIINSIAVGTGIGISSLLPRLVAQKKQKEANYAAHSGFMLNIIYTIFFMVLSFIIVKPFYYMQTDIQVIVDMGISYLHIVMLGCFGMFFGQCFEKMLVASGYSTLAMIAQASGAIFNLIFDPLLIFGIGPFPELGIVGAALATIMGQIFAGFLALFFNFQKNKTVNLSIKQLRLEKESTINILKIGFPTMITLGLTSVGAFFINQILLRHSTTATAVYGIWIKLQLFCFMPIIGMNNGLIPILSYNFGAKYYDRVKSAMKISIIFGFSLMVVITTILELIPQPFLTAFNASDALMEIGIICIKVCALSLPFGGLCYIFSACGQAMDHPNFALAINATRNFFFPIILFSLLSLIFRNLSIVWFAIPLSEILSFTIGFILTNKLLKEINQKELQLNNK